MRDLPRPKLLIDLSLLRRKANISYAAAARMIGVRLETYGRVERGDIPSFEAALKVARFLKVPLEKVWQFEEFLENPSEGKPEKPDAPE